MPAPDSVEAYLAALPDARRSRMESLREAIRAAAPEATEAISYQMPSFRLDGRFLVSYAVYKAHDSLFPASQAVVEALGEELTPYLTGKGTIRFHADEPLPLALVKRIVRVRVAEERPQARSPYPGAASSGVR